MRSPWWFRGKSGSEELLEVSLPNKCWWWAFVDVVRGCTCPALGNPGTDDINPWSKCWVHLEMRYQYITTNENVY